MLNNKIINLEKMQEDNINMKKKYQNDMEKLLQKINDLSKKNKDLERQLKEEKEIKNYIYDNNAKKNEIMELIREIRSKNDKLKMIKLKIGFDDIRENEEIIGIIIQSLDQKIRHVFICKDSDKLNNIEGLLYDFYPEYKNSENYFLFGGIKINKFNTMKENKIQNSSIITLVRYDENTNIYK